MFPSWIQSFLNPNFVPPGNLYCTHGEPVMCAAFKSGRNERQRTGSRRGDNARLLTISSTAAAGSDSQGNIKRASPAHKWVRFWLWPVLVWQKAVGRKKGWTKVEALSGLKGPTLWGHHFLLLIAPQATQRASSRLFEEKERGRIRSLNKAIYYQTTLNCVNKFKLSRFAIQGKE